MIETRKREPTLFELMTGDEKAELLRNELYWTHARRGNPGFFYEMYPDLKPRKERDDGREGSER